MTLAFILPCFTVTENVMLYKGKICFRKHLSVHLLFKHINQKLKNLLCMLPKCFTALFNFPYASVAGVTSSMSGTTSNQ